jgi:O-methyltransferase involved in polyketide biosynthesis
MPDDQVPDDQAPAGIDPAVPTAARIYDYLLGGHDNFAADRAAAGRVAALSPEIALVARTNRAFLGRTVRFLAAEAGIRQFLDLGAGLPTNGNVHQVAQASAAGTRVVYVDNDPSVLAHSQALTAGADTAVIQSDLRDPATILAHPDTGRLIDLTQPLAILFVAVLHFVPDPDAQQAVAAFTSVAAPGSYLVLSHGCSDPDPVAAAAGAARYAAGAYSAVPRSRTGILGFFAVFDLVDPGLVPVHQWRPSPDDPADPGKVWLVGGVGRKSSAQ